MGSLCPRPIFCFPWFVQKKIEKIGDFFFPGCAALGTDGMRCGVSSLSFPTVGRGRWHRARGDLGGREGLWGSLLPHLQHFVAPPSSSIAAHCSASSTSSLKHFPFIFILWRGFKSGFPLAKPPDPWTMGLCCPQRPQSWGSPGQGLQGGKGQRPLGTLTPCCPRCWSHLAPSPPHGTSLHVASPKSPPKFSNSFPMSVSIPHLFFLAEKTSQMRIFPSRVPTDSRLISLRQPEGEPRVLNSWAILELFLSFSFPPFLPLLRKNKSRNFNVFSRSEIAK